MTTYADELKTVYAVAYNSYEEGYSNRGYWESSIDEDEGIFLNKEDAEKRADEFNGSTLARFREKIAQDKAWNDKLTKEYEQKLKERDYLIAGGFKPPYLKKPNYRVVSEDFAEWVERTDTSYYIVVELKVHA